MNTLKAPSLQSLLESDRGSNDSLLAESLQLDFDEVIVDDNQWKCLCFESYRTSILSKLKKNRFFQVKMTKIHFEISKNDQKVSKRRKISSNCRKLAKVSLESRKMSNRSFENSKVTKKKSQNVGESLQKLKSL